MEMCPRPLRAAHSRARTRRVSTARTRAISNGHSRFASPCLRLDWPRYSMALPQVAAMITTDRFVTHVSTVPATRGQKVGLFVREKALAATLEQRKPHVVLMVHGGFAPSIVAYDLQYRDYSFMSA